jgi:hypothetical protein
MTLPWSTSLLLLDTSNDREWPCVIHGTRSTDAATLSVTVPDLSATLEAEGQDFEDALQLLRRDLETRGFLLLCNRFRKNAFVSSMSRQMSDGLSCYLVQRYRTVSPRRVVDCLAPAGRSAVVTYNESEAYLEAWKSSCRRIPIWLLALRK